MATVSDAGLRMIGDSNQEEEAQRRRQMVEDEQRLRQTELVAHRSQLRKSKEDKKNFTARTFTWAEGSRQAFNWLSTYHAFEGVVQKQGHGGFISEVPIGHRAMRLYTYHRVADKVVLPGVNHISLMATTGLLAAGDNPGNFHMKLAEVMFERPFYVNPAPEAGEVEGEDGLGFVVCSAGNVVRASGDIPKALNLY